MLGTIYVLSIITIGSIIIVIDLIFLDGEE